MIAFIMSPFQSLPQTPAVTATLFNYVITPDVASERLCELRAAVPQSHPAAENGIRHAKTTTHTHTLT